MDGLEKDQGETTSTSGRTLIFSPERAAPPMATDD